MRINLSYNGTRLSRFDASTTDMLTTENGLFKNFFLQYPRGWTAEFSVTCVFSDIVLGVVLSLYLVG